MRVRQTIAIRVGEAGIIARVIGIALARVHHTIEIGIFTAVGNAAIIRVGIDAAGSGGPHVTIGGAMVGRRIGVGITAVQTLFDAVPQAVVVAIGVEHIDEAIAIAVSAVVGLVAVEHTVVVAVLIVGIAAQ